MSERLYYTDPYLTEFSAAVTGTSDDGLRVYLDRTAFYPTSGGQPHDTGTLGGQPVTDVIDEGERVAHLLASPLAPAASVKGLVDWPRRFDHMQQHTAQHLLSAVLDQLFGARTASVHFGDATSTVDIEREALTTAELEVTERRVNGVILENRPVTITFEAADAVEGLRKASKRAGELRIISIEGVDKSACGGTHVRSTGEIGPLLVLGAERVKGQVRVEFVAGGRAIGHARRNEELVRAASRILSAPAPDVPAALEQLAAQLRDARASLRKLGIEMAASRAASLAGAAEADAHGVRKVTLASHDYSADELRALSQAMSAHAGVRFVATIEDPPMIFIAAGPGSGWDAGAVLKAALAEVGGRGGGSPRAAQGTVGSVMELERVALRLVSSS